MVSASTFPHSTSSPRHWMTRTTQQGSRSDRYPRSVLEQPITRPSMTSAPEDHRAARARTTVLLARVQTEPTPKGPLYLRFCTPAGTRALQS